MRILIFLTTTLHLFTWSETSLTAGRFDLSVCRGAKFLVRGKDVGFQDMKQCVRIHLVICWMQTLLFIFVWLLFNCCYYFINSLSKRSCESISGIWSRFEKFIRLYGQFRTNIKRSRFRQHVVWSIWLLYYRILPRLFILLFIRISHCCFILILNTL